MIKQKILIVDDEPAICDLLRIIFEPKGFVVQTALSGEEGFVKFREFKPDIVLTDGKMPGMDGAEFARRIKKHSPYLPVILVTGMLIAIKNREYFDAIVTKPFHVNAITTIVEALLPPKLSEAENTSFFSTWRGLIPAEQSIICWRPNAIRFRELVSLAA